MLESLNLLTKIAEETYWLLWHLLVSSNAIAGGGTGSRAHLQHEMESLSRYMALNEGRWYWEDEWSEDID